MRLVSLFLVSICLIVSYIGQYAEGQDINDWFRREHSLIKPFGGTSYWDFVGGTIISNKFIRLTMDTQSSQGGLWNLFPVQMKDWEVQFQFHVHGNGKELFGDGFAFWYTKQRNFLGPVFGSKDYFKGLAIFMDTYTNNNGPNNHPHPYISAMVNNGSLHYNNDKDGADTELAGCEAAFRMRSFDTFLAIRYQNYKLTVSTDIENKNEWKECFSVSGVRLPTGYYFGFSAATGELSDNHDILSVKVYQLDSERKNEVEDSSLIDPEAENFAPPKEHQPDEKPSVAWTIFKWFFIIFFMVLALVLIVGGIYWFVTKQQRTKKRFY